MFKSSPKKWASSFKKKPCKGIQEDHDELHEKNHNCLGMDRECKRNLFINVKRMGIVE